MPLGLPFNVTQYATLLSLFAQCADLKPGTLDWSIKDAHIYVNQVKGIKEQLNREEAYDTYKKLDKDCLLKIKETLLSSKNQFDYKLDNETLLKILDLIVEPEKPYLWLNPDIKDFYSFDNSKNLDDIKVKNYKHMGKIKFPIAQ